MMNLFVYEAFTTQVYLINHHETLDTRCPGNREEHEVHFIPIECKPNFGPKFVINM